MSKEIIIQAIKDAGKSIIDNAESIAGDYKYPLEVDINVRLSADDAYVPRIDANVSWSPEQFVDRQKGVTSL
jgi:hypothetical protein